MEIKKMIIYRNLYYGLIKNILIEMLAEVWFYILSTFK